MVFTGGGFLSRYPQSNLTNPTINHFGVPPIRVIDSSNTGYANCNMGMIGRTDTVLKMRHPKEIRHISECVGSVVAETIYAHTHTHTHAKDTVNRCFLSIKGKKSGAACRKP